MYQRLDQGREKGESYYWLIPGQWANELRNVVGLEGRLFLTAAEAECKRSCECVSNKELLCKYFSTQHEPTGHGYDVCQEAAGH